MQNATWSPGCTPAARRRRDRRLAAASSSANVVTAPVPAMRSAGLSRIRVDVRAGVHGTGRYPTVPSRDGSRSRAVRPAGALRVPRRRRRRRHPPRPHRAGDGVRPARPPGRRRARRARRPRRRLPGDDVRRAAPLPVRGPRLRRRRRALRRPVQLLPRRRAAASPWAADPPGHGDDRGRPPGRHRRRGGRHAAALPGPRRRRTPTPSPIRSPACPSIAAARGPASRRSPPGACRGRTATSSRPSHG